MQPYQVSVVICAYTEARWDQLTAAVESVAGQTHPVLETIVVVDHNPSLLERVKAKFPWAVVVANHETPGLSGARNSGMALAKGDIVAFLDDDAVAERDWIERLLDGYSDPNVIGVGGSLEPVWCDGRPAWFPREFDWVVGCTYLGMPEQASPVRNLIGANMSLRRDRLLQMGSFHPDLRRVGNFPSGCEETELCIRARQLWPGTVLLYDPAARVRHQVPSSRATTTYFRYRCYTEGLMKARVSALVGRRDGLESEFAYSLRVLTRGVFRGIRDSVLARDPGGLRRAAAIVVGFASTTAGYLVGTFSSARINQERVSAAKASTTSVKAVGDRSA